MFNFLFEKEVLKRELIKADFDVEQGVADGGIVADQGDQLLSQWITVAMLLDKTLDGGVFSCEA